MEEFPGKRITPRIVYSPRYNIGLLGFERLHTFDSHKYGRAWKQLRRWFGGQLGAFRVRPPRPVNRAELLSVHTPEYLKKLRDRKFVAGVVEIPQLRVSAGVGADASAISTAAMIALTTDVNQLIAEISA